MCNAIGAALCAVSATVDCIVDLLPSSIDGGKQRKCELDRLILAARQQCEQNGACSDTVQIVDIEQVPLAYYPSGHKHRVKLTAIGRLDMTKFKQTEQEERVERPFLEVKKEAPLDIRPPIHVDLTKKRPVFDENGVWCVDSIDIEYIAYGTDILGNLFASFSVNLIEYRLQVVVVVVNPITVSCGVLKFYAKTDSRCVWCLLRSFVPRRIWWSMLALWERPLFLTNCCQVVMIVYWLSMLSKSIYLEKLVLFTVEKSVVPMV